MVNTPEIRQRLLEFSFDQPQVVDASHLLVLAVKTDIDDAYIDQYIQRMAALRQTTVAALASFDTMVRNFVHARSPEAIQVWAKHQVYIALGQLMTSAAHLGIDSCPMEGFIPEKYDQILGLTAKGYASVLVCPVGYRDPTDPYAHHPKVRFSEASMVEVL